MTDFSVDKVLIYVASYVASAAWQIPLLFIAAQFCGRVLQRLGPAAEHKLWQWTLVLCVLLPALPLPHSDSRVISIETSDTQNRSDLPTPVSSTYVSRSPLRVPVAVVYGLCGLWFLATLFATVRLGIAISCTRKLFLTSQPCLLPPHMEEVWQNVLWRFGGLKARIFISHLVNGPVTISLDGHALLLPESFIDEVNLVQFRAAVAHECAHMRRSDFVSNLSHNLIALPTTFHPVMRFVRRRLVTTREMACDQSAAGAMESTSSYCTALLSLAKSMVNSHPLHARSISTAVGIFDSNSLEERMKRLSIPVKIVSGAAKIGRVATAITCLTIAVSAAAVGSTRLAPLTHASLTLPSQPHLSAPLALQTTAQHEGVTSIQAQSPRMNGAPTAAQQHGGDRTGQVAAHQVEATKSQDSQTLCAVQIANNRRISQEAILARLSSRQGTRYDPTTIEADFNALWNTGDFEDVQIAKTDAADCVQIVVSVHEKPTTR